MKPAENTVKLCITPGYNLINLFVRAKVCWQGVRPNGRGAGRAGEAPAPAGAAGRLAGW